MERRLFATDTDVPVGRTQEAIRKELRRLDADEIAPFESKRTGLMGVMAMLDGAPVRIAVEIPNEREFDTERAFEQEERRRWRVIHCLVKSVRVLAEDGAVPLRHLILPFVVRPDGLTVGVAFEREYAELGNYASGPMLGLPEAGEETG